MSISVEAKRKLDRINEIVVEMCGLEGELEGLLTSVGSRPLTVRDKTIQVSKPNGGKGRPTSDRTCGKCLKKGHNARTCPGGSKAPRESYKPVDDVALTEEQYNEAQYSKNLDMTANDVAEEMGKSIDEVNAAFVARTYAAYLQLRKRNGLT